MFGAERVQGSAPCVVVTLACARLGWPVAETEVISLVTDDPRSAVRRGGRAVVLSRDADTPAALARLLVDTGRGASACTVFEQFGGPSERRRTLPPRNGLPDPPADVDPLNVVAVNYAARRAAAGGP